MTPSRIIEARERMMSLATCFVKTACGVRSYTVYRVVSMHTPIALMTRIILRSKINTRDTQLASRSKCNNKSHYFGGAITADFHTRDIFLHLLSNSYLELFLKNWSCSLKKAKKTLNLFVFILPDTSCMQRMSPS
jgi:hypothetical protein